MTQVHPETAIINMPVELDSENANNNNLPKVDRKPSISSSVCAKNSDVRNETLYRPGIGIDDGLRPIPASLSVANGRRLLVTGRSLNIPPQEFLEDITKCFSRTNTLYIRKTKDVSKGLLGFQVIAGYEVLNESLARICVLGLVDTVFSGFQFIIVNPFGVDAFVYKKCYCGPDVISGPGISAYSFSSGRNNNVNFATDNCWYKLSLGLQGTLFPHWTFPFCGSYGSGPNFVFRNGLDQERVLARITREKSLKSEKSKDTLKLEFFPALADSERIAIFSTSLYTFFYHFVPRGKATTAFYSFIQLSLWFTLVFMIFVFLVVP